MKRADNNAITGAKTFRKDAFLEIAGRIFCEGYREQPAVWLIEKQVGCSFRQHSCFAASRTGQYRAMTANSNCTALIGVKLHSLRSSSFHSPQAQQQLPA